MNAADPSAGDVTGDVIGYRSKWSLVHAVSLLVTWTVVSLIGLLAVPSVFVKAVLLAVALVLLVPIVRRLTSSLTIDAVGLVVRSVGSTARVPWSAIAAVDVGSKRIVGSGSKAYFLRYQTDGDKVPVRSTLVGWGPDGRAAMIRLLDACERCSSGANVTVSRSDPWNAATTFPRSSSRG